MESWRGRVRVKNSRGTGMDSHRTEKLTQIHRMGRGRPGGHDTGSKQKGALN